MPLHYKAQKFAPYTLTLFEQTWTAVQHLTSVQGLHQIMLQGLSNDTGYIIT